MSHPPAPTISHRIEYLAFRFFEQILKRMSLETVFKIGEFVGRVFHLLHSQRRRQVIKNLTYAFGDEKTGTEIEEIAGQVFERTGANFLSSIKVPFLTDEEIAKHVTFDGAHEHIREAQDGGLVFVSPHMGNWELLAQAIFLAKGEIEVATHYRPLNNTLLNSVIVRRRKKRGLQLFAKHTSTHRLISFIREGGGLGILADQKVGSRGTACVFFGRPTTSSPLPHIIAKRGNAQLMSLVCETVGIGQWQIRFAHIPKITPQAVADSVEAAWRRSPADVFWFEDRWRIKGEAPLKFLTKYSETSGVTRPLRLVNFAEGRNHQPYPEWLITQQIADLDFSLDDKSLTRELTKIDERGPVAPDIFICPQDHLKRLKKLSRKTLILSDSLDC